MQEKYDNRKTAAKAEYREKTGGYFSVEAALVMPIVLATIAFVMYLLLFTYDRCLSEQDVGMVAFRGAVAGEDNEARMDAMKQCYGEIYQDKYFAWDWGTPDFSAGRGKVSVHQRGSMKTLFPDLGIPETSLWNTEIRYRNEICNPVAFVRTLRKLTGGR